GLRPVINASATLTALGGSLMPSEVIAAMAEAAAAFTDIREMQRKAGERIAELTGNEACFVSSGAAGGIALSVAACVAGTDPVLTGKLPNLDDVPRKDVVVLAAQRNGYDFAARQTGARLVEVGPTAADVAAAIGPNTAAVLWFAGAHFAPGAAPIEDVVAVAHAAGVPVIVDAAAQIPPITNLWRFTRDVGADAAVFSGGKGLRGPQPTGLVLGRREIIEGCRWHGSPNYSIGRPMKVGKEELAGIVAAVELAVEAAADEPALLAGYEATVQGWLDGLRGIPGIVAERGYPSEAGQPHSRAIVRILPEAGLARQAIVDALWEGEPRIAVGILANDDDAIALNPQTLQLGEAELVLARLREVLEA
ncbi:MAG TPA: aminotransferase class V-fold PLP-dependent enzyme, partial [Thermomicrobiales bacterium]|nr:aminotransferase class V-fold PLP-dependent enzyme [Thermomicrobiales bacterium]